jgi:hypothetical protein
MLVPTGIEDTRGAGNSTSGPAGGATLAQINTGLVNGGVYDVEATIALTATAETALRNIFLQNSGSNVATLPTLTGQVIKLRYRITMPSSGSCSVTLVTVAGAVAGAIYNTVLTATRIG